MSETRQVFHAFKWSMLGELASRAIGPVVFLVLARLLVPEDFGLLAAATVIISFFQVLSDAGLGKALIQRQDRGDESANVIFWLSLGVGSLVVIVLLIGAPYVAAFFNDERVTLVVRVLSPAVLMAAIASVPTALLQKELNFKQLFWVRLATTAVPGLMSIPLALNGMGYWALVIGALAGQVLQTVALWKSIHWRPAFSFDRPLAGELMAFGKWAMFSGILGWFYVWMDAVIVGHYLGAYEMGLYRTGNAMVAMLFGLVFSPLLPVLYSVLSRANGDLQRLREVLLLVVKGTAIIGFPLAISLFVLQSQIEQYIFGSSWEGIGHVVAVLGLAHGVAWSVGFNGEVYRAAGKPHLETWSMAISVMVYLAGYLFAIQYGLQVFLLTRLALVFAGVLGHLFVSRRFLGLSIFRLGEAIFRQALLGTIALCVALYFISPREVGDGSEFYKAALLLTGYGVAVALLNRAPIKTVLMHLEAEFFRCTANKRS